MGIKSFNKNEERLGEIRKNKDSLGGYEMKIIEYNRNKDIIVEFQDEYKAKVHVCYNDFQNGQVKNPYHPSIYGFGYVGKGKYKVSEDGKNTKAYQIWKDMLKRCYDPYYINKHLTYKDCFVCEEWHCFQNFSEWFYKNYYEIEEQRMELDKDILCKGNKIYSPNTCIFVPRRINLLFCKSDAIRGKYPIGVSWAKANNKFRAQCQILDKDGKKKRKGLGYYDASDEAFLAYKTFKENYIKQVADEYKDLIPIELYDVMYKYEVEIND